MLCARHFVYIIWSFTKLTCPKSLNLEAVARIQTRIQARFKNFLPSNWSHCGSARVKQHLKPWGSDQLPWISASPCNICPGRYWKARQHSYYLFPWLPGFSNVPMWEMLDSEGVSVSVPMIRTGILTWGLPRNLIHCSKEGLGQPVGHRVITAEPWVRFHILFYSQHIELSISHLGPNPPPHSSHPNMYTQVWCPHSSLADRHPSCPVAPGRVGDNINPSVFKWWQRESCVLQRGSLFLLAGLGDQGQPMAQFPNTLNVY